MAGQDAGCERLMSVPGIGPIIASATVAAIGTGDTFSKGRDFAAWLGLVPKQISTGDRTILGSISKRGNRYLRVLFVQAAWVVLIRPKSWERHGLKSWLQKAAAPQGAGHCTRQQAGSHRLERSGTWPGLRSEPARSGDCLIWMIVERKRAAPADIDEYRSTPRSARG
jgi:transposase